jgi:threonine dehydrogenase-like Zn-dependent dehydrogenase
VPRGDTNLLKLPDSVPDEKGSFTNPFHIVSPYTLRKLGLHLSDVLCTSWHCVVDTGVSKGDVAAIWGAGP